MKTLKILFLIINLVQITSCNSKKDKIHYPDPNLKADVKPSEDEQKKKTELEKKQKEQAEIERKKKEDVAVEELEKKKKDDAELERKKREDAELEQKKKEQAEIERKKKEEEAELARKRSIDSDGDFIPDYLDPMPLVARNILDSFDIQYGDVDFHYYMKGSQSLLKYLASNFSQNSHQYMINTHFGVSSNLIKSSEQSLIGINKKSNWFKEIKIQLNQGETPLFNITEEYIKEKVSASKKNLKLSLLQFRVIDTDKLISAKEYLDSLNLKTYQFSIIDEDTVKTFRVSTKLKPVEALKRVAFSDQQISNFQENLIDNFRNDIKSYPKAHKVWFEVNFSGLALNQPIQAGQHIALVSMPIQNIISYSNTTYEEELHLYLPTIKVSPYHSKDITFSFKGYVALNTLVESNHKTFNSNNPINPKKFECNYIKKTAQARRIEINNSNFFAYFDLIADGKLINSKQVTGPITIQNSSQYKTLLFKLKPKYQVNIVAGEFKSSIHPTCLYKNLDYHHFIKKNVFRHINHSIIVKKTMTLKSI